MRLMMQGTFLAGALAFLSGVTGGFAASLETYRPAPTRRKVPGAGVERAAERLRVKREANRLIPDTSVMTRQRRRFAERKARK